MNCGKTRATGLGDRQFKFINRRYLLLRGDYCALANAKSIPIAEAIQDRFDDLDYLHDLFTIDFNVSGCMNACGHHHVANIGVLGVDKKAKSFIKLPSAANKASTLKSPTFLAHR